MLILHTECYSSQGQGRTLFKLKWNRKYLKNNKNISKFYQKFMKFFDN